MSRPTANGAMMNMKISGISWNTRCWAGSGAGGLIEVVSHIVKP